MPVRVCDLVSQGGCGDSAGEVAPTFGPLRPCPRCGEPHGIVRCRRCHS